MIRMLNKYIPVWSLPNTLYPFRSGVYVSSIFPYGYWTQPPQLSWVRLPTSPHSHLTQSIFSRFARYDGRWWHPQVSADVRACWIITHNPMDVTILWPAVFAGSLVEFWFTEALQAWDSTSLEGRTGRESSSLLSWQGGQLTSAESCTRAIRSSV